MDFFKTIPKGVYYVIFIFLAGLILFKPSWVLDVVKTIAIDSKRDTSSSDSPKTIQCKGQIVGISGITLENVRLKFSEDSYNETHTKKEGKFEIKGVQYNEKNNIKHLLIICPEGSTIEVKAFDLNNLDNYPLINGWIELGQIEVFKPCKGSINESLKNDKKHLIKNNLSNQDKTLKNELLNLVVTHNYADKLKINSSIVIENDYEGTFYLKVSKGMNHIACLNSEDEVIGEFFGEINKNSKLIFSGTKYIFE